VGRVTASITIERPVEEVFGFVADERNEPLYNPQMVSVEKLSAGPPGHSSFAGITTDGDLTFEAVEGSTRLTRDWRTTPAGVLKLLSPLVTWVGRRQEARIWGALKAVPESGPVDEAGQQADRAHQRI
jgi:uncharacterized protein YndB with AHSA1/START domain